MAQYTPAFLRALRQRYENTDQLMTSIAAEFEIGVRTLQRMVMTQGWRKRSLRARALPIAVGLLEEAQALQTSIRHPEVRAQRATASRPWPTCAAEIQSRVNPRLLGDGPDVSPDYGPHPSRLGAARLAPQDDGDGTEAPSPIDRLEALVVKEIEAEEAARAQLVGKRRVVGAAERSARTLATLTQTLHALQRLRAGNAPEHETLTDDDMPDDLPRDIDEFRRDLARRIDAFVASRTDAGDADGDSGVTPVDAAG
jgi:hypothetical protein